MSAAAERLAKEVKRARTLEEAHATADGLLARMRKDKAAHVAKPPAPGKSRDERRKERKSKSAARSDIRAACVEREEGRCAIPGCPHDVLHLDHFWGRGKVPEAVENCWMLCIDHDRQKTLNRPSRRAWINTFRDHAKKHGYDAQVAKCDGAIALEAAQHPEHRKETKSCPF